MATRKQIDEVIVLAMAIKGYAKDIHYNCTDYSDHLLVDDIAKGLYSDIDSIKENILLGNSQKVLSHKDYFERASKIVPTVTNDVEGNFKELDKLVTSILKVIDGLSLDKADDDVMVKIANKMKKAKGLLFLRLGLWQK